MDRFLVLKIRLFGAFRNLSPSKEIDIKLRGRATIAEIKAELASQLSTSHPSFDVGELLSRSVLANEVRVLDDSEIIEDEICLSILPPVCGG